MKFEVFSACAIISGFLLQSCSTAPIGPAQNIISLAPQFQSYLEASQGQPPAQKLRLWEELIEKPEKLFYDSVVWDRYSNPEWQERRKRVLAAFLPKYEGLASKMRRLFADLPALVIVQGERFQRIFPDSRLDFPIYAAPAPTFNGRGATLENPQKTQVLAIGVDQVSERGDKLPVLAAHEIFHLHHARQSGFLNDGMVPGGRLVSALWAEGLATYVSGLLNPDESDESLLMDHDLARVSAAELPWLAREFLKHAKKISLEAANAGTVRSWFSSGREKLRAGLPDRCGYLLGLEVARRLAKNYTVLEMASWNPQEAEVLVRETLEKMSR